MDEETRHDPIVSSLEGHVLVVSKQNGKAALTPDGLVRRILRRRLLLFFYTVRKGYRNLLVIAPLETTPLLTATPKWGFA